MADIAKCFGVGCPIKDTCRRYLVPSQERGQSYLSEVPYDNGECEYYWETNNKENEKT